VTSQDDNKSVQVELHGSVSGLNGSTFKLRNEIVHWDNNTAFESPLSDTTLINGENIKVIGEIVDGDVLAISITLEN
jgi:hypothetical protein